MTRQRRRARRRQILDMTAGAGIFIMLRAFINAVGLTAGAPEWAVVALFAILLALTALMLWCYREARRLL